MLRSILRVLLTLLFTYVVAIGATFNGVISPDFKTPTLILLGIVVGAWLLIRWWRGWQWHTTSLDGALLLWVLAFAVAFVANPEVWRRSTVAFWYMALYIGGWYILQDSLANRRLARGQLIDGLLITGLIVLIFGYLQVYGWLNTQLPLILNGRAAFDLPRPVSTLGNTNALGTFLIVLTAFALGRLATANNAIGRVVLGGYSLLTILLAILTYSRGTWLGLGVVVVVFVALLLAQYHLLSPARLWAIWAGLTPVRKNLVRGLGLILVAGAFVLALLFIDTFTQPGRTLERRTVLYEPAISMFSEKPFTGYGLFTFGRGYARLVSMPPNQPHSHAHNAVLHIAAELGLVGLAALFTTLGVFFVTLRRNWRAAPEQERFLLASAVAGVSGFAVHHLLDTPAMMPAIALTGLLALSLALAPFQPQPILNRARRMGSLIILVGLWVVVLVSGFWSSGIYRQYIDFLQEGLRTRDYAAAAEQLQVVVDADPALALYSLEQGYLYGLAAADGDVQALEHGLESYTRYLELEPYYAVSWANLAALYWQAGQTEQAIAAMQRAVELAPGAWALHFNLGVYLEQQGDMSGAQMAFERALNSQSYLYPEWQASELRQQLVSAYVPNGLGSVVLALEARDVNGALQAWEQAVSEKTPRYYVLRLLIALAGQDQGGLDVWLAEARAAVFPGQDQDAAWIHLAQAYIAQANGDTSTALRERAAAHELLTPALLEEDYMYGSNVPYFQFLRAAINRQFLSQVFYPTADALLVHLLAALDELQG